MKSYPGATTPGTGALLALVVFAAVNCGGSSPTSPSQSPSGNSATPNIDVCGVISSITSQGIVNGTVCSATNSPVVLVSLYDDAGPIGTCSGTVIAPDAVLTAAHCLAGETKRVSIWLGSGPLIPAASLRPIPQYVPTDLSTLDVGVVLMSASLGRRSVPMLTSRDAKIGEQGVIAGWGVDTVGTDGKLRAGVATVTNVTPNFIMTTFNGSGANTCNGDSGGPLLLNEGGVWSVAGVTSSGTNNCASGTSNFSNLRNSTILSFVTGLVPDAAER